MKKLFTFLAAALMSVFAFASLDVVPSDAVLADYYDQGQVCVCFFVPADMACNDIVLTGSFNGWKSTVSGCPLCEAVEGYDGWYVAAFDPEADPDMYKGIQAKPIMLDGMGQFNWEYQIGAATAIRGGVQVVLGSYAGEIDMINYGTDAPNVFTVDAWKRNPCTAIYHNYTVTVVSDGCDGMVVPYMVGAMNGWSFEEMTLDAAKSQSYGVPTYTYSFKAAEGTPYQIVSGLKDSLGNIVEYAAWSVDAYMQKLVAGVWVRMPGEDGDNLLTHEDANILFDLRADDLRWARCDGIVAEQVTVYIAVPEGAPAAIEMMGSFDKWTDGVEMTEYTTGRWKATVSAKATDVFQFRQAGNWENQIEYYDENEDAWYTFNNDGIYLVFGDYWYEEGGAHAVFLDFSDPENYRWQIPTEEPIIPEDTIVRVVVNVRVPSKCMPEAGIDIIGTFDEWTGVEMQYDAAISSYVALVEATASQYFKFRSSGSWEQEIEYFDLNSEYWRVFADGELVFGQLWYDGYYYGEKVKIIELNFSDSTLYRWSNCQPEVPEEAEYTIVFVNVPAGAPAAGVEVIGSFDGWTGTQMELLDNGWYFAAIQAKPSDEFKFRGTGSWEYEIVEATTGLPMSNITFKDVWSDDTWKGVPCKWIELDFSSDYVWSDQSIDPEEPVMLTIKQAENGCVKLEVNSEETYTFHIVPSEGWQIHTVMYNGMDVTSSVQDGKIQLSGITISSELNITFATAPSGAENVSANKVKVFGQKENVIITNAEKNDPISIFTENGMLVKEFIADSDRMSIKLQSGLYLVKVKGLAVKVLL